MKRKKNLGALGEAAHSAQLIVGHDVYTPKGTRQLTQRELKRIVVAASKKGNGPLTNSSGEGLYFDTKARALYGPEKASVLTMFVPEREAATGKRFSCVAVQRRARDIAAEVARLGKQNSVLVHVTCANGSQDVSLIGKDGKLRDPLPGLRPARGQRRGAKRRRSQRR